MAFNNQASDLRIERASRYKDISVAEAYLFRPPYAPETFEILANLIQDSPKIVLDVGCGNGTIARNLVYLVDRVDAIDFSSPMIEVGKTLPNGNHPNLRWILSQVEDAELNPQYSLITAGQSLHWLDLDRVFSRFREILVPDGYVAIIEVAEEKENLPWRNELKNIIKKYSTNPDWKPFDYVDEMERNNLFQKYGEKTTGTVLFEQNIDEYVKSFHSMSSLARKAMGEENADRFDDEVKKLITNYRAKET
jgi:ubiquinone/menaquinone biosynthesis C-methylase UbiE